MSLYGAKELNYASFGGGLVLDVDPAQLAPDQSPACQNVDLDARSLVTRSGRTQEGTTKTGTAVRGLLAYYPADGSARQTLHAVGTSVYADATAILSGLSGGTDPMDLLPYRDRVYLGDKTNGLYQWTGSGLATAVALLAAPDLPALAPKQALAESFESGTWTESPGSGSIAVSYVSTDVVKQGAYCLRMEVTGTGAEGVQYTKAWSAGATLDLSGAESVKVWVRGKKSSLAFQVGVLDNSGAIDWADFPVFTVPKRLEWRQYEVPLAALAPEDRSASTGIALRYVDSGRHTPSSSDPLRLWFDQAELQGPLPPDTYRYSLTHAVYESGVLTRESNASAENSILLDGQVPVAGVTVAYDAPADAAVTHIRIWRIRDEGPFRRPRLVAEVAAGSGTYVDTTADLTLATEDRDEQDDGLITPPAADTYALVNHRLFAGTGRRVYVSRLGRPGEFSNTEDPDSLIAGGWFDLHEHAPIRRILGVEGLVLIFTASAVWSLEGGGFPDYMLAKRLEHGLVAREAVCQVGNLVYFLAEDGLRVLRVGGPHERHFESFLVSEPVRSRIDAQPAAYRHLAALGVDEQGRLHLSLVESGGTAPTVALVFDPRAEGALTPRLTPDRRGWTYYTSWGFRCFARTRSGSGDTGKLLAGDAAAGKVWLLGSGTTDDGAAISWSWRSRVETLPRNERFEPVYVAADVDASAGAALDVAAIQDRGARTTTKTLSLTEASGQDSPLSRLAASVRGRELQLQASGDDPLTVRGLACGFYRRGL